MCNYDGFKDLTEECDGIDFGVENCEALGFSGGVLDCTSTCTFDTGGCVDCPTGRIYCNDECVDPDSDLRHCSDCGLECGNAEVCIAAQCEELNSGWTAVGNDPPLAVMTVGTSAAHDMTTDGDDAFVAWVDASFARVMQYASGGPWQWLDPSPLFGLTMLMPAVSIRTVGSVP
ncbi:MAG: hypothetical protein V3T05_03055, partial [Myxococcota bacterium]